ncbi:MAG: hypothetical protein HUU49_04375 [Candidatus Buchananbacteria bacterium]|nr:hypothetical protein [Candidatus Buchananbacteria bacterium]
MKHLAMIFCLAVFGIASAQDQTGKVLVSSVSDSDQVQELHLIRQVFDQSYVGPYRSLEYPAAVAAHYVDWEEVYFNHMVYRHKLVGLVDDNWAVGPWWWQTSVSVRLPEPLVRGAPIRFIVSYPLIEWREPLVYSVVKAPDGTTRIKVLSGSYVTPRFSYPVAMILMLVCFFVVGVLIFCALRLIIWLGRRLIDALTGYLMKGHTDPKLEAWTRRFVMCILGALIFIATGIAWLAYLIYNR